MTATDHAVDPTLDVVGQGDGGEGGRLSGRPHPTLATTVVTARQHTTISKRECYTTVPRPPGDPLAARDGGGGGDIVCVAQSELTM